MRLEYVIKELFTDNPNLNKSEAIKRLKEMKDPETGKHRWKAHTIRCQIGTYFNRKEKKVQAVHVEFPVKTTYPESNPKREGKEITHHRPNDPFAIKSEGNVGEKVDQIEDAKVAEADEQVFKKGIVDNVSKKDPEQVSMDAKPFRDEIISIVSDFISEVRGEFTNDRKEISDLKKEVSNLRTQGIPAYKPIVKYDDLKLRISTIDEIQNITDDRELGEESDYIDILIASYYEPIVKIKDYYESIAEYGNLNLKQSTIDIIRKNTEEKELKEESEYIDNLIRNEEIYISKALKISS